MGVASKFRNLSRLNEVERAGIGRIYHARWLLKCKVYRGIMSYVFLDTWAGTESFGKCGCDTIKDLAGMANVRLR